MRNSLGRLFLDVIISSERLRKWINGFFAERQKGTLFVLLLAVIVGGGFSFLNNSSSNLIIFFFAWWFLAVFILRLDGRASVAVGAFFLLFCPLSLILGKREFAERSAVLAYLLFLAGVFQQFGAIVWEENVKKGRYTNPKTNLPFL